MEENAGDEPLTLSELLAGTARGDESSFAAFYEATSDVVYGLALLMHEHPDGAYYSTLAVYQHLWDQADERAQDLRLQSATSQALTEEHLGSPDSGGEESAYRPSEYELVLEWLVPLAHRIMVERFRDASPSPSASLLSRTLKAAAWPASPRRSSTISPLSPTPRPRPWR